MAGVVIEDIIQSRSSMKIAQTPEKTRRLVVVPSPELLVNISIVFVVLALIISKQDVVNSEASGVIS